MLQFVSRQTSSNLEGDLVVIPFWQGKDKPEAAFAVFEEWRPFLDKIMHFKDFSGKMGQTTLLYPECMPSRVLILGLGFQEEVSKEVLRRAFAEVMKRAVGKKWFQISILMPKISSIEQARVDSLVCETMVLSSYTFEGLKSEKNRKECHVEKIFCLGTSPDFDKVAKRASNLGVGVNYARDLVNGNADSVTPQYLEKQALWLSEEFDAIETKTFSKKEIEKMQMQLLLSVNRGAMSDPAFIVMEYKGDPDSKEKSVIVGKGVTYDTGGLNLKPTGFMEEMKTDMSGAAAVFGVLRAAAALQLKANITGVVPATENAIGCKSYKPGDVYGSFAGKSVEITNTDAEGRLVLADALAYAVKHLNPTRLIDLATLTGAVVISLGVDRSGAFSNSEDLIKTALECGELTGEKVCSFPMDSEYRKLLDSDIADIKNCHTKREAGSITAAKFLEEFVDKTPWIHFDIAGTNYLDRPRWYHLTKATGVGVRLVVEMLCKLHGISR